MLVESSCKGSSLSIQCFKPSLAALESKRWLVKRVINATKMEKHCALVAYISEAGSKV